MVHTVYLASGTELRIESPFEAPQYPLDCGWWRFLVVRSGEQEELLGEFQTKNAKARHKVDLVYTWVEGLIGFPHVGILKRSLYTPSTWKAVIEVAISQA